jgi:oligopeptidase B
MRLEAGARASHFAQMHKPVPPLPRKIPQEFEQLGRRRTDDYAWMKDENWREVLRDPKALRTDIREHLEAENAYTKAMLSETEPLQAALFAEMRGRIKEDDSSVPTPDGAWDYYVRYETGAQHPVHARRPRDRAEGEEILLDEEAEAKDKPYFHVGGAGHSPDHALFGWAADAQGSEYYEIQVLDLASGAVLPGPAASASGDFVFSPDSQWLFWVWRDDNARPARVFRRPARGGEDALVYEEKDEGMFLGLGVTADRRYVLIQIGNQETTEVRIIPAEDPTAEPAVAEPRQVGVKYDLDHWTDRWVIRTNADEAVDFKLCVSTADIPSRGSWRDWVAHQPGRYITGFLAFAGHLIRAERVDALDRLAIMARGGEEHPIAFDEEAYALGLSGGYEYETAMVRFTYESPTTPRRWFDYDMDSRSRTLRKTQEIPSGHDPSRYVARRLSARAGDGAEVPVTVLMLRDTPLDGSAPLMVYGYGAYGHAMEPTFSTRT